MTTVASPMTLGQRLDAAIDNIDSLSSTQLYVVIVAGTVAVSFFLLNSNGSTSNTASGTSVDNALLKSAKPRSSSCSSDLPQPRWFILKWLNFAAILAFGGSVVKFSLNASLYLNDSKYLLQFLVVWSMFLCYFFGFFGISFVNADELVGNMEQEQREQQQQQQQQQRYVE